MSNSKQPRVTQNRILLLLLALTLIRGLIYASVTIPWWMGHDEDFHFTQIRSLIDQWSSANSGRQNQNWPQEMVASFATFPLSQWHPNPEDPVNLIDISDRHSHLTRHSLSYYPYAWLGQFLTNQDLLFQLFAYRIVSVLITCGTITLALFSARQIFPESLMAQILVPWYILFNPSFMITASTVRDGNLAILFVSIVFYLLLLEHSKERVGWRSLLAVILTVAAFWTKATTYFLVLVWGVLLIVYIWRWKPNLKYWLWIGLGGSLLVVASLFSVFGRLQGYLTLYRPTQASSEEVTLATRAGRYLYYIFTSFWAALGHETYRLPSIWYIILLLFLLLATVGLLRYGWRHLRRNESRPKGLLLAFLFAGLCIVTMIGVGVLRGELFGFGLARYIFPAIIPVSILMVAGWHELLPSGWQNIALILLAIFFFLFDTAVWLIYAIPWYYPFWPY
jgi:hypothetical protein